MKTSSAGLDLIKKYEGCRLDAYQDIGGVWTIGYGDTKDVHPDQHITQQQAEDGLVRRLTEEFEPAIMRAISNAPTSQNQFDAMASLSWNIGIGAFSGSSVARYHKANNYQAAANAFTAWNKVKGKVIAGLVRRRAEERSLYLSDVQSTQTDDPVFDAMKKVQIALHDAGLYDGAIDGDYGALTSDAYREYRRTHAI